LSATLLLVASNASKPLPSPLFFGAIVKPLLCL
jgi:hypothetical protein